MAKQFKNEQENAVIYRYMTIQFKTNGDVALFMTKYNKSRDVNFGLENSEEE